MSDELKNRASKRFNQYLKDFKTNGTVMALPRERLSDAEWQELNKIIRNQGVVLVPTVKNGYEYMAFSALAAPDMSDELKNRASKRFNQYLQDFKTNGTPIALPRDRLNDAEWQELNQIISDQGVTLEPTVIDGHEYMEFRILIIPVGYEKAPSKQEIFNRGLDKLASDYGKKLEQITGVKWTHMSAEESGLKHEHFRMPIDNMTPKQAQQLIDKLQQNGIDGVRAVRTNKGRFLLFDPANTVLDNILGEYTKHNIKGGNIPVYIYDTDKLSDKYMLQKASGLGRAMAEAIAEKINAAGKHYAVALGKKGESGQDYIVISIRKSDAKSLLDTTEENGILVHHKDSTENIRYLNRLVETKTPLTYIGKTPVILESIEDFGVRSDRAILLVDVGGKKLPFYISSGTAGKTDVPTGKWEFFGGIDKTGWFRKGTLENILTHYDSPELKTIADALDSKIGDIRDCVDVLRSAGREYLGGDGDVAYMQNAPEISVARINQDVFVPENDGIFWYDLDMVIRYLRELGQQKNLTQYFQKSEKEIKKNLKSKLESFLDSLKNKGNENE
ncbi:MAG: hypothetical protein J6K82_03735 [Alphaproteobacteria bacterium]|nr:hypothetical protein [Alphaproteobacteria bacterium]